MKIQRYTKTHDAHRKNPPDKKKLPSFGRLIFILARTIFTFFAWIHVAIFLVMLSNVHVQFSSVLFHFYKAVVVQLPTFVYTFFFLYLRKSSNIFLKFSSVLSKTNKSYFAIYIFFLKKSIIKGRPLSVTKFGTTVT